MNERKIGRVSRVDAKVCHVDVDGETILAAPRGTLFEGLEAKNPIAVGDWVEVSLDGDPVGIEAVRARRNYLARIASSHDPREQVLAANVDQLFIVGSLKKPGFSSNRTDRILAACFWQDIPAVLILNKMDIAKASELDAIRATYERIPIPVLVTCAKDGRGIDELVEMLRGKVSVFYGPSGAGKSTLLNRIQPGLNIREGKVSSYWAQGRHTTSFSTLHLLTLPGDHGPDAEKSYVIDTPGIRVFRPFGLKRGQVRDLFPDFHPFQGRCHFPNCTHDHEPDCAVCDAVEAGELAATRYGSYVDMLDEIDPEGAYEPEEMMGDEAGEEP